jgi:uncharacterized membrane protein YdjX (TVP38/TMEM64 family)
VISRTDEARATSLKQGTRAFLLRRWLPLALIAGLAIFIIAMGWHRQLSLENLVRHQAALEALVAAHGAATLAAFVAIYVAVVSLSVPGAVFLTIAGGVLFGALTGALATLVGATLGATVLFLLAKTAFGEHLMRRAGPLAERLAKGFREDAFSYLLFLRLVPLFPFFLVNLVPALAGVRLFPFVAATALGIIPGTLVFSFFGASLNDALAAEGAIYKACLASNRTDCRLDFDLNAALTPQLFVALVGLGLLALVPVIVKRLRARRSGRSSS